MASRTGSVPSGSSMGGENDAEGELAAAVEVNPEVEVSAEVPHSHGVRDLKRVRRELAERLYAQGVPGGQRRAALTEFVNARLAEHFAETLQAVVPGGAEG